MTWIRKGLFVINKPEQLLSLKLTSRLLIKVSYVRNGKDTWHWAGKVQQINKENLLSTVVSSSDILIKQQILFTPQKFSDNYQISFIKAKWIESLQIVLHEQSEPLIFDLCQALKSCNFTSSSNTFSASGGGKFETNTPTDNIAFAYTQDFL